MILLVPAGAPVAAADQLFRVSEIAKPVRGCSAAVGAKALQDAARAVEDELAAGFVEDLEALSARLEAALERTEDHLARAPRVAALQEPA